jgi:hypothetical protein
MQIKPIYNQDCELRTICGCYELLKDLSSDAQWRILNYLIVRLFGRSCTLAKPKSDIR